MGAGAPAPATASQDGPPAAAQPAHLAGRHLLRRPRGACLAPPAPRMAALEDGLPLLPAMAPGRDVGGPMGLWGGARGVFPRLRHVWADQGYAGVLRTWTREQTGIELEVVYPWGRQIKRYMPDLLEPLGVGKGFHVLPRRWVVERTFAWLGRYRRLSRDYERPAAPTEAPILVALARLLRRRPARLRSVSDPV